MGRQSLRQGSILVVGHEMDPFGCGRIDVEKDVMHYHGGKMRVKKAKEPSNWKGGEERSPLVPTNYRLSFASYYLH